MYLHRVLDAKGRRAMRDDGMDTLTIGFAIYHLKDPEGAPRYVFRCNTI